MKITLTWNGNSYEISPNLKDEGDSFQQHDERMRKFCLAHSEREPTKLPAAEADDFLVSLPIRTIKLAKYARN